MERVDKLKDFLGRELAVGDFVVADKGGRYAAWLYGEIIKITKVKVHIAPSKSSRGMYRWNQGEVFQQFPDKVVKVERVE